MKTISRIRFRFNEVRATQVASRLVAKSGNRLSHLALMKMLYIVDREALARWERPVIGGKYTSMKHGTVISEVLNLMRSIEGVDDDSTWSEHLTKSGNEMRLLAPTGTEDLSPGELKLVDEVFEKYGHLSKWELRDLTHTFPEWEDVGDTSKKIDVEKILESVGKDKREIDRVAEEVAYLAAVDELIAQRD